MKKLFTVQNQEVRVEYSFSDPLLLLWSTIREDGEYSYLERFDSAETAHQHFQNTTYARAKEVFQVLEPTKTQDDNFQP